MLLQKLDMSFEYRDDILLRAYVLIHKHNGTWKQFCRLRANRKVQFESVYKMHKSIRKHGQRTPIYVVKYEGKYYPADGATRLGVILALGLPIKATRIKSRTKRKWRDPITLGTHHFKGMKRMQKFVEFKKIFMSESWSEA